MIKNLLSIMLVGLSPLIILSQDDLQRDYGPMTSMNSDQIGRINFAGDGMAKTDSTVVKLTLFLEGAFDKGKMNTEVNKLGLLPLNQPFNSPPWNYSGTESVSAIPNIDVVDWILVDIRAADSAGGATSETIIARKAGFLMSSGAIFNTDGSSLLSFDTVFS
jgi:hypothetical protein